MGVWLDGILRAYSAFHRADPAACLNYIQRLFEICINECFLSVYKRVQSKATNVLKVCSIRVESSFEENRIVSFRPLSKTS